MSTTKNARRTDCHRPGAIVPSEYKLEDVYALPGGEDEEGFNYREVADLTKSHKANEGHVFGSLGSCGVCGASFVRGTIWRHEPTGDLVHMGADCADKYNLAGSDPSFDAALAALDRGRAARITAHANDLAYAAFVAQRPGLAEALEVDHEILASLKDRLRYWHTLSDRQVALALKVAGEVKARAEAPAEVHVEAPEGPQHVEGVVVSTKWHSSQYGETLKMTVRVETPAGSWLAWGTVPSSLEGHPGGLKGARIAFDATVQRGDREQHFAFFKRPKKARVLSLGGVAA